MGELDCYAALGKHRETRNPGRNLPLPNWFSP
ncbi:UNVERIFIED_ORG: hypothetical protein GGD44_006316 [Rhizobium esperanzae]